jgi:hypothetical protein
METGCPEWTPMPETVARAPSVVCLPAFMSPSRNPLVIEPLVAAPSSPVLPFPRPRGTCFAALREIAEAPLLPSPTRCCPLPPDRSSRSQQLRLTPRSQQGHPPGPPRLAKSSVSRLSACHNLPNAQPASAVRSSDPRKQPDLSARQFHGTRQRRISASLGTHRSTRCPPPQKAPFPGATRQGGGPLANPRTALNKIRTAPPSPSPCDREEGVKRTSNDHANRCTGLSPSLATPFQGISVCGPSASRCPVW